MAQNTKVIFIDKVSDLDGALAEIENNYEILQIVGNIEKLLSADGTIKYSCAVLVK